MSRAGTAVCLLITSTRGGGNASHCLPVDVIESDPVFSRENQYFQSQNERYEAAVRKAVHVRKKMQELGWSEDGPESVYVYR